MLQVVTFRKLRNANRNVYIRPKQSIYCIKRGKEKMSGNINKTRVSPTPIVLAYFAEKNQGTLQEVTRFVFAVVRKTQDSKNLYIDAIFRGHLKSPDSGTITSETVDQELSYWTSNGFLKTELNRDDLCFKIDPNKMYIFEPYLIKNLLDNLDGINWVRDCDKEEFVEILTTQLQQI